MVSEDKSNDFDNDNDDEDQPSSSAPRRTSSKNVNILGFNLPAESVNLALGILGAIGTIGTGIVLYDKFNQNKQQQEALKKQQEQEELQAFYKKLAEQQAPPQQQDQRMQNNGGAYLTNDLFSSSPDYLAAINSELDGKEQEPQEQPVKVNVNTQPTQIPQSPQVNVGQYLQEKKKDNSIYQSNQVPDPTTYF